MGYWVKLGCSRARFLAAFGRVSPISMSESSDSAAVLAVCGPAGMRVARFHIGVGSDIIAHAHLALKRKSSAVSVGSI